MPSSYLSWLFSTISPAAANAPALLISVFLMRLLEDKVGAIDKPANVEKQRGAADAS